MKVFSSEKERHKNRYNVLGRGLPKSPGALEYQMKTTFTDEERALAGQAINELENKGFITPTYKDLSAPGDWLVITPLGENALETGALDALDNLLIEINSNYDLLSVRNGAHEALLSKQSDWARHVAASCRELITIVLHTIAPNEEVIKDPKFIPDTSSANKITRKERIKYYLRKKGSLSKRDTEIVEEAYNLIDKCYKKLSAISHTDNQEAEYLVKLTEDALYFLLKQGQKDN
ncbi:MAG: pPIWI-associating nuclease domain-containing protein [Candidatus Humimicrobiaceae bacterium]